MAYWLAISNRENSAVVIRENVWGVSKRHINVIQKVRPGDKILIYTSQKVVDKEVLPPTIAAVFEVTSGMYEDSSRMFTAPAKLGDEIFPLRIELKIITIFDPPIEFKPLIPKLKFITNKTMWSGHIRGQAMRQIPEEDYQLIVSSGTP